MSDARNMRLNFQVSQELHDKLSNLSKERGVSISEMVRILVEESPASSGKKATESDRPFY